MILPGATGTAEGYYKQFLSLCPKGIRCISVQPPDYMTHETFLKGLEKFMEKIGVEKAHFFGTSIGGFEAQLFTQARPSKVLSLMLCNTFSDTSHYKENAPCVEIFPFMPEFMLKRVVLENLPKGKMESEIADSVDFMVEQLETISQKELCSRLTLNCSIPTQTLNPSSWTFNSKKILILDSIDEVAIPEKLRSDVYKFYPEAKIAELKSGGNFPFLSRPDEINMYIQVHLRSVSSLNDEENSKQSVEHKEIQNQNQKQEKVESPKQTIESTQFSTESDNQN